MLLSIGHSVYCIVILLGIPKVQGCLTQYTIIYFTFHRPDLISKPVLLTSNLKCVFFFQVDFVGNPLLCVSLYPLFFSLFFFSFANNNLHSLIFVADKNGGRTSASADSIDVDRARVSPETHRRSKSILKKHDSAANNSSSHRNGPSKNDPETEKLISDNTSMTSGSEYSPGPRVGNAARLRAAYQRQLSQSKMPVQLVSLAGSTNSEIVLLQDLLGNAHTAAPLYICPPPPPMEQSNEESLLLQRNDAEIKYL